MRSGYAFALALIAATPAALHACTCASYEPKPCRLYHTVPVIVRARILDHNHQRDKLDPVTLYRFSVVEVFKGLSPDVEQILIDPSNWSSCYTEFREGVDYLLYLGGPSTFTTKWTDHLDRPAPSAWTPALLSSLPVFRVGTCDPRRRIDQPSTDPDLMYLRAAKHFTPDTPGWIEGRAVQHHDWLLRVRDLVGAPGVTIRLASSAVTHTITLPVGGDYRSPALPPGVYTLTSRSNLLGTPTEGNRAEVQVHPGGCVVSHAYFDSRASVSGRVVDSAGRPAPHVRLELGEILPNRSVRVVPQTWADTAADGSFTIERAPIGRIVLGANLNGAPREGAPFNPVYAPGTQYLRRARILALQPGQHLSGVELKLPPPLPFGDLHVDVLWPDGSPAADEARASAYVGTRRAAFGQAPEGTNTVSLRLALGHTYNLQASWNTSPAPDRYIHLEWTPAQRFRFTRSGQRITIRLTEPPPPRE